tara:strand:- start:1432 stop:1596 length:165 start_codon:yes stop_codon:yes gene_type:complete
MDKNKIWTFGDSKLDRQGRLIFFVGYSEETNLKNELIELWEPENIFKSRNKENE